MTDMNQMIDDGEVICHVCYPYGKMLVVTHISKRFNVYKEVARGLYTWIDTAYTIDATDPVAIRLQAIEMLTERLERYELE